MINYFSNLSYFLEKNGIIDKSINISNLKEAKSITYSLSQILSKINPKSNFLYN